MGVVFLFLTSQINNFEFVIFFHNCSEMVAVNDHVLLILFVYIIMKFSIIFSLIDK